MTNYTELPFSSEYMTDLIAAFNKNEPALTRRIQDILDDSPALERNIQRSFDDAVRENLNPGLKRPTVRISPTTKELTIDGVSIADITTRFDVDVRKDMTARVTIEMFPNIEVNYL